MKSKLTQRKKLERKRREIKRKKAEKRPIQLKASDAIKLLEKAGFIEVGPGVYSRGAEVIKINQKRREVRDKHTIKRLLKIIKRGR